MVRVSSNILDPCVKARAIHCSSGRKEARFVAVDCGAIPRSLTRRLYYSVFYNALARGCKAAGFPDAEATGPCWQRPVEASQIKPREIGQELPPFGFTTLKIKHKLSV